MFKALTFSLVASLIYIHSATPATHQWWMKRDPRDRNFSFVNVNAVTATSSNGNGSSGFTSPFPLPFRIPILYVNSVPYSSYSSGSPLAASSSVPQYYTVPEPVPAQIQEPIPLAHPQPQPHPQQLQQPLPLPVINEHFLKTVIQCPLDKDLTGRYSWSVLHTFAAHYPDGELTQKDRDDIIHFLRLFGRLYPCKTFGEDFEKLVKTNQPHLRRGRDFGLYLCQLHNSINRKLGKNNFDCGLLDARWKQGLPDGSCLEFPLVPASFLSPNFNYSHVQFHALK